MRNETMAKRVRENLAKLNTQKAEIQTEIDKQEQLLAILDPGHGPSVTGTAKNSGLGVVAESPPAAVARKGAA
jgi:hypothetical protein